MAAWALSAGSPAKHPGMAPAVRNTYCGRQAASANVFSAVLAQTGFTARIGL
jgi:hypothetical protein